MKLKIMVLEQDQMLRELLRACFSEYGHDVLTFSDPTACPLYRKQLHEECRCSDERPCSDVILVDFNVPGINALDFLRLQQRRGCKVLDANKALMGTGLIRTLKQTVEELGCHYIEKPFHLATISQWLRDCAARIERHAGDTPPASPSG